MDGVCGRRCWVAPGHAEQESERQERKAVRGTPQEGDVEGARGAHRELSRRLEPRWQEVRLFELAVELEPGRHNGAEESRRPQGWQGRRAQVLGTALSPDERSHRGAGPSACTRYNSPAAGEFPSGQRGRAVNPLALPSEVRILSPPLRRAKSGCCAAMTTLRGVTAWPRAD